MYFVSKSLYMGSLKLHIAALTETLVYISNKDTDISVARRFYSSDVLLNKTSNFCCWTYFLYF